MSFVTNKKAAKAADARDFAMIAAQDGRGVMLYRFDIPASRSGWSGPIDDGSAVIDAVERVGWRLQHMAYDPRQSQNGALLLLFRRIA